MRKILSVKNAVATLAFALFATAAISATETKAAPTYNPVTDKIESLDDGIYYVANVKKAEGAKLKTSNFQKITSGPGLAMEKGGFKASISKDAYLYWDTKNPTEWTDAEKESAKTTAFSPNLTIKAAAYKKTVVNLDYTKLGQDVMMVSSVDVTKNESGATAAKMADIENSMSWTADLTKAWQPLSDFTGEVVAPEIAKAKYVVYFRANGSSSQRPSKMVKVTLSKRANAPKLKVDVKKLTLNIKNGYDFATKYVDFGSTAAVSGSSISVSGGAFVFDEVFDPNSSNAALTWFTILPTDKEGAYKDTTGKETAVKPTSDYVPMNKKDEGAKAKSYTSIKKTFDLKLDAGLDGAESYDDAVLIATRKTATTKKPASLMGCIVVDAAAGAPYITTKSTTHYEADGTTVDFVERFATIATGDAIEFVTPSIEKDFMMDTDETTGESTKKVTLDNATAKFEYAIVKKEDYNANTINFASISWKSIKTGTKIKDNAKTKYTSISDSKTKIEATIGESSYLIIRRAGVSKTGVVASKLLRTSVKPITGGYEWYIVDRDASSEEDFPVPTP